MSSSNKLRERFQLQLILQPTSISINKVHFSACNSQPHQIQLYICIVTDPYTWIYTVKNSVQSSVSMSAMCSLYRSKLSFQKCTSIAFFVCYCCHLIVNPHIRMVYENYSKDFHLMSRNGIPRVIQPFMAHERKWNCSISLTLLFVVLLMDIRANVSVGVYVCLLGKVEWNVASYAWPFFAGKLHFKYFYTMWQSFEMI